VTVMAASPVAQAIAAVPDPEVPVVSIEDLGILRGVEVDEPARRVTVTITPTYSGCPAMQAYDCTVQTRLSPAWTTDWMTEQGRERLRAFGIAPPGPAGEAAERRPVGLSLQRRQVACPQCGSTDTEEIARFGSTACKALRRCRSCGEPFDEFKAI
jgi:ring-1,2-phenylacetyl-CoA epoxidase subunit PaaD